MDCILSQGILKLFLMFDSISFTIIVISVNYLDKKIIVLPF